LKIAQRHFIEEGREPGIVQSDFACERIEFETETGLQQRKRRCRGRMIALS
jgi:hypothetical protein